MAKAHHFRIEVGPKQHEGYPFNVSSNVGEAKGILDVPFKGRSLDKMLKQIGHIDDTSARPSVNEEKLKTIGRKLFRAFFKGETKSLLSAGLSTSKSGLILHLQCDDPLVARLPWELLHDGVLFQVSSGKLRLSRYIPLLQHIPSVSVRGPLRVLIVVSRPLDQHQMDPTGETQAIIKGLGVLEEKGRVVVDVLRPPTHKALVEWLSDPDFQYHILHFDGHGTFENGEGYVVFEDDFGRSDKVSASTIANTLCGSGLKLVVLSACLSGVPSSTDLYRGVSQALITAGVPVVIAMQFSVPINSTIGFFQQVYSSLGKGNTVLKAVTHGRKTLYPLGTWYFPVLYQRSKETKLIKRGKMRTGIARRWLQPPHNLPVDLHPYIVGRHNELIETSRSLALPGVITVIWGPGGIGKTAIGVATAKRNDWRFTDGILYVEARGGKTLDTILNEIASHLSIPISMEIEEKTKLILEAFLERNYLLVVDNFEDVESNVEILGFLSRIRAPTKVLLTSRHHPMRTSWLSIRLQPMPLHDSINLFIQTAHEVSQGFSEKEIGNVEAICKSLRGYPLAIKIAARATLSSSPGEILEELKERLPEGIEAPLGLSFEAMRQEERSLLKRLSVFEEVFDDAVICALSQSKEKGDHITDWRKHKNELVRRSFLSRRKELYFLHPVIRQFAYKKLEDKKKWHLVAADYFAEKGYWINAFDHFYEAENWEAAIELAIASGPKAHTQIELAGEITLRLEVAYKLSTTKLKDFRLGLTTLESLVVIYIYMGKFASAETCFKKAIRKVKALLRKGKEDITDQETLGRLLSNYGSLLAMTGAFDKARSKFEESLRVKKALLERDKENTEYQLTTAATLVNLGSLIYETEVGKPHEAYPMLDAAVTELRVVHEKDKKNVECLVALYTGLNSLGNILCDMERFDEATSKLKEAIQIQRALLRRDKNNVRHQEALGLSLSNLGKAFAVLGRDEQARPNFQESIRVWKEMIDRDEENAKFQLGLAGSIRNFGVYLRDSEKYEEAIKLLDEAFQILVKLYERKKDDARIRWHYEDIMVNLCLTHVKLGRSLQRGDARAYEHYLQACSGSLWHSWKFHSHVVNLVINQLRELREKGDTKFASDLCEYLIKGWRRMQLDRKVPQFIDVIQKEKKSYEEN